MANVSGFTLQYADVETLTANRTLTARDTGKLFIADAVDLVVTLPAVDATMKGVWFSFFVKTVSTVTGLQLSPAAADLVRAAGVTAADNKDLINSAATDAVGDSVRLVCDGVDGWIAMNMRGTFAREA